MKTLAMASLAALVLAAPFAASAQTVYGQRGVDDNTITVAVTTADLDLSRPDQARIMLGRIDRAALQACGASEFSAPQYRDVVKKSACFQAGVQQALAQVDSPVVNRIYQRHAQVEVQTGE